MIHVHKRGSDGAALPGNRASHPRDFPTFPLLSLSRSPRVYGYVTGKQHPVDESPWAPIDRAARAARAFIHSAKESKSARTEPRGDRERFLRCDLIRPLYKLKIREGAAARA